MNKGFNVSLFSNKLYISTHQDPRSEMWGYGVHMANGDSYRLIRKSAAFAKSEKVAISYADALVDGVRTMSLHSKYFFS